MRIFESHGDGSFRRDEFARTGDHVVFEHGTKVWNPETISIGDNVYVGHGAMLKGYPDSRMTIGNDVWIGQNVFLHSAGGITIGNRVGIGPGVMVLTSYHKDLGPKIPLLDSPLEFKPVAIRDDVDIGIGAILLPGVTVGEGAQIGAGAVVTKDVEPHTVVAGNPAKLLRRRS